MYRPCLLVVVACGWLREADARTLTPECTAYLSKNGLADPTSLKSRLTQCNFDQSKQEPYAPNPRPPVPGVTDTTELSCRYGHPSLYGPTGGTCCGWKPHFNWVLATCDPSEQQQESNFCRNLPSCVREKGKDSCGAKVNYVAAYQYNGSHFVLMDDSTVGRKSDAGVEGSYEAGEGWEEEKRNFTWRSGDWTSKYAPWGDGPAGPRGGTPPATLWVMSADNFYYGAFYMLSQLTLNLEGKGNPTGTNCWSWELDPVEGTKGWVPPGAPLPGNVNQLYATNNAAVSGCMPVTYSAMQANGLRRSFSEPAMFREYCAKNQGAVGCEPWKEDVMWSGGVFGTQRFENYADQPYVFAVVVDHRGYWIYRWIPDGSGKTGWPGIDRHRAARVLVKRPRAVVHPGGLATDVRGNVPEAVILQPSVPPEAACLRSSFESINFQFGADALGAMATELGENGRGGVFEGAQNWWAHFADTEQYQQYPLSIAGVPWQSLQDTYRCNRDGTFTGNCKMQSGGGTRRLNETIPRRSKVEEASPNVLI